MATMSRFDERAKEQDVRLYSGATLDYEFDEDVKLTKRGWNVLMALPEKRAIKLQLDDSPDDSLTIDILRHLSVQTEYFEVFQRSPHLFYIVDTERITDM